MVLTFKNIQKIKFPVYPLLSGNWSRSDGLLFLDEKIIDDRNMKGDTLGIRRVQTPHKSLYPLKYQVDNFRGIIKSDKKHFIDTHGLPFIYEKTEFCKLKYYKIMKVVKKDICALLYLEGVKSSFILPRPPSSDIRYAGVLHYHNLPWVLYDYSEEWKKDTTRKV